MVVEIDFERSGGSNGVYILYLVDRDKPGGENMGAFTGYTEETRDENPRGVRTWWDWENPDAPDSEVTFSPSIIQHCGDEQEFHIFVRNGEIEHCGNCQCGC